MPSIVVCFLPVALFAILHVVAPAEEGSPLAGDSPHKNTPTKIRGPLSKHSEAMDVAVNFVEEGSPMAGDSSPKNTPKWLFRKRALEAAIRGPPSIKSESQIESPAKRDGWYWMPAHGYVTAPPYEEPDTPEPQRLGNLCHCG